MNTKLEVVRLANEDVIATSSVQIWGIAYFLKDEENYSMSEGLKNGTNNDNIGPDRMIGTKTFYSKPNGFIGDGVYHIDSNGKIIEKCTCPNTTNVSASPDHDTNVGY